MTTDTTKLADEILTMLFAGNLDAYIASYDPEAVKTFLVKNRRPIYDALRRCPGAQPVTAREPTDVMLNAGATVTGRRPSGITYGEWCFDVGQIWRAMFDAALRAPDAEPVANRHIPNLRGTAIDIGYRVQCLVNMIDAFDAAINGPAADAGYCGFCLRNVYSNDNRCPQCGTKLANVQVNGPAACTNSTAANAAQQEQHDDNESDSGRACRLAGEGDVGDVGPERGTVKGEPHHSTAERDAGLLRAQPRGDSRQGNAESNIAINGPAACSVTRPASTAPNVEQGESAGSGATLSREDAFFAAAPSPPDAPPRAGSGATLPDGLADAIKVVQKLADGPGNYEPFKSALPKVLTAARSAQGMAEELANVKADYIRACQTVAAMHEAATGIKGGGPKRGVVEDVIDLRDELARVRAELAEAKKDAERLDFMLTRSGHGVHCYAVRQGDPYEDEPPFIVEEVRIDYTECRMGGADTPRAAIDAALKTNAKT